MPKTHLKKFYQEQEHGSSKSGQDQTCSANKLHVKKEHNSFSADESLMPKWLCYSNNNPLNQFAEITLATHAKSHEILLAKYLQRLQGGLEQKPTPRSNKHIPTPPPLSQHYPIHHTPPQLTPSNSPSPPPAHISPTVSIQEKRSKQPPLPPLHTRLDLLPPPQTAPEDLRVVARKIEFPIVNKASCDSTAHNRLNSRALVDSHTHDRLSSRALVDCSTAAGDIIETEDDIGNIPDIEYFDNEFGTEGSVHSQRLSDDGSGFGGQHECPDCGKTYSTSSNLARHRQTHRSLEDKKARKCPHCEKTYVSMPAYSMHIRTHNQGCKCPFCGKCFSRPWLLQGHIRTHTGEKPFLCHICNKAFADKSNLRAHIQTHSNTKPFLCVRCNKAFALKSYLYKHEESSCMKMTKNNNINIPESHISSENSHNITHPEEKIRRKSASSSTSEVSNPAPLPTITSENNNTAFGQQLLLALSKARAVAAFDSA